MVMASPSHHHSPSAAFSSGTTSTTTVEYRKQAEKLSHVTSTQDDNNGAGTAVAAEFITPQDPVIILAGGGRLPGVPLAEADKLNALREEAGLLPNHSDAIPAHHVSGSASPDDEATIQKSGEGPLRKAMPPSRTNPLFPPLPLYGPSSIMRDVQCYTFRVSSFFLSLAFLGIIVLGSAFTSIPLMFNHIWLRITFRDPDRKRPFKDQERARKRTREEAEKLWKIKASEPHSKSSVDEEDEDAASYGGFIPTEGGPDPLVCDVGYYARRVGLDVEEFAVQTEDGFIISLFHLFNPLEYTPLTAAEREARGPNLSTPSSNFTSSTSSHKPKPKFPVLMIHGLMQSSGAYCVTDDSSLAFYLCKAGYDVWLGNNRCGFKPQHTLLSYGDPRMWAWNIRQMGVIDLPALTSRVLAETGFAKLGLIAHSQGTTQTFVALAKEQRPDLGDKLTVFCALAPAAYAGPLIGKAYFKFMRVISPALFRLIFGIHAFIPFMLTMHACLPGRLYGAMGYRVFSFLFNWTDARWDRGLRDRMFQFSPVYVSAESMRWWLGRECFARQKCILATREEGHAEEMEDYHADLVEGKKKSRRYSLGEKEALKRLILGEKKKLERKPKGSTAWYNDQVPPFALWVAGSDDLVDGRRLLRRFDRGREPHVRVVHSKVIEEYEHLDVIWAMDSIEKVGREVKEVIWKTCNVRDKVRTPEGCEEVAAWVDEKNKSEQSEDEDQSSSEENTM